MKVVLGKRGVKRLLDRHLWVWRGDVAAMPQKAGIYPVYGERGLLAWALVNPASLISVRVFHFGHSKDPLAQLWRNLENAWELRRRYYSAHPEGGVRLVHAEGDLLPGLVVDSYARHLVLQAHAAAWEPLLPELARRLQDLSGAKSVIARHDSPLRLKEGLPRYVRVLSGEAAETAVLREGEVRYRVALLTGQKTGAFLDQRDNRLLLAKYAHGKNYQRALDVFAYQGLFALQLASRLQEVEVVDSSAEALRAAADNAALNNVENVSFNQANAFELLRQREREGEKYDVIVLDPPALAARKSDRERAAAAYKEINLRALKLLKRGGLLASASCSHHLPEEDFYRILAAAAADSHRLLRVLERRGQGWDHPTLLTVPETRYLKFALLEVVE